MAQPPGWIGLLIGLATEVVKESVREGLKASVAAEKKELVKQLKDCMDRNREMRMVIEEWQDRGCGAGRL